MWRCPSCGADAATPFCGTCGERRLVESDLTLKHYAEAAAESVFSWDGRIFATLASFVRRPGELTVAYLEGRRKPFLNPLQLFLLVNVLFFVQQGITNWNTYSTPFMGHMAQSPYAPLARFIARIRIDQLGLPYEGPELEAYARRFNDAVKLSAKSLLVLLVPFVTLLITAVRLGRPRQAVVHLTVGFHLTTYLLAVQTIMLPAFTLVQVVATARGAPVNEGLIDDISTWLQKLALFAVAIPLLRQAYGADRRSAIVQSALIAYLHLWCVQGYRLVLLVLTLFTTR
ncbi:MAG: DUF3667 domain-containing protein [Gemmatimonadaceae bacterium]|nr:DUF3667 domain-containing protein [Gemmatimonadaceae bacterium]